MKELQEKERSVASMARRDAPSDGETRVSGLSLLLLRPVFGFTDDTKAA